MTADPLDRSLALYFHWPFCEKKCPYCDFNSHVRAEIDQQRWRDAFLAEIDLVAAEVEPAIGKPLIPSIFFGGGTPSLMPPATVDAILQKVHDCFDVSQDCEITLEANPSSVESARFADLRAAGVNRLSLGVQSFDDAALRFLGRLHSAADGRAAIKTAREHFDRYSFDLIYALPGQSLAAWDAMLGQAIEEAHGHLSLYQLTIEPATGFAAAHEKGRLQMPSDDDAADLYEHTQAITDAAGFHTYEISNYAQPGEECRHNLVYWRGGYYAGFGPGAHGRLPYVSRHTVATATFKRPERWLTAIEARTQRYSETKCLPHSERAVEVVLSGLRLAEGFRFSQLGAYSPIELFNQDKINDLKDKQLIYLDDKGLRINQDYRLLTEFIAHSLINDHNLRERSVD